MRRTVAVRIVIASAAAVALLAAGLPVIGGETSAVAAGSKLPPLPKARDAKVQRLQVAAAKQSEAQRAQEMARSPQAAPAIWPAAADQVITLGAATSSPIKLAPAKTRAKGSLAAPAKARLRVLDQASATAADVSGFLFGLQRADQGTGEAPAQVTIDYSGFAQASGGDWASRLKLVSLPACALTTPRKEGCLVAAEVGSVNDAEKQTLTAPVTVSGAERVMAVTAASSGSTGDYGATPLSPAATWSAGRSSGDFTWNYPLRVPPAPAGPAPSLSINYSAQSVDGKTVATNSQSSEIGEGFSLTESYVERKYGSCVNDGQTGKYDLCWKYDNASLVLNGQANELVKGANGWRLKNDDGSKVEKVVNPTANGDDDKEAWKVTTLDGTQYFFGRQPVAGQNSVWTVPVAGDDANEPCHQSTFATSFCDTQAWRWNLDYVLDPHGNAMTLWYAKETNYYARNGVTTATKAYDRGGYATKILYGQRSDTLTATAPMQVVFDTAERCLSNCTTLTSTTKANWPDVPFDQICAAGATCTKVAPSFFSRRRIVKVTTSVLKGTAYQSVDSWSLVHDFPAPSDPMSGKSLWLQSITHTGTAAAPTAAAPLTVSFGKSPLPNRVDSQNDGIGPMTKIRVGNIWTETGAQITVNYAAPECVAGVKMPAAADTNTLRCYPVKWQPPLEAEREDWFHRHVVSQVRVNDLTGGADAMVTNYSYGGGAAWHFDENPFIKAEDRNWSDWRGFRTVTTSVGDPFQPGPRSRTVTSYFRGMNGDKLKAGGTKSVTVPDTQGGSRADAPALTGLVREAITYAADGSNTEVSGNLTDYWVQETANQTVETGIVRRASFAKPSAVAARIARDGGRSDLVHVASTQYDPATGLPTQSQDEGDSTKTDEQCTITSYVKNSSTGMALTSRVVTSKGRCDSASANPPESRELSDIRTIYDNAAFGAAPTKGDVTSTQRLTGYTTAGAPVYQSVGTAVYDTLGRVTSSTDALGRISSTAYTPAGAGALTQTISKSPAVVMSDGTSKTLDTKTTNYRPEWGLPSKTSDPNGKVTEMAYDALGQLIAVWLPSQAPASCRSSPTRSTPTRCRTRRPRRSGPIRSTSTRTVTSLVVSAVRLVAEAQAVPARRPGASAGRVIGETRYDAHQLAIYENKDIWNSSAPAAALVCCPERLGSEPDFQRVRRRRPERERVDLHDRVCRQSGRPPPSMAGTAPPPCCRPRVVAATATVTDARGQVVERREFGGNTATAEHQDGHEKYTFDLEAVG